MTTRGSIPVGKQARPRKRDAVVAVPQVVCVKYDREVNGQIAFVLMGRTSLVRLDDRGNDTQLPIKIGRAQYYGVVTGLDIRERGGSTQVTRIYMQVPSKPAGADSGDVYVIINVDEDGTLNPVHAYATGTGGNTDMINRLLLG